MEYRIIILSPEMFQSRTFVNHIVRNTRFMRNMISLFIDEAHCIVHWGADFRKAYGTLGNMRVFFPPGTSVAAVTATLTSRVRRTMHSSLHFAQSSKPSRFINQGNDRPNVSIIVRACEHTLNSFEDLAFLVPSTVRRAEDIPKTYLYIDNIATGGDIIDYIHSKLANVPGFSSRIGVARPFNATHSASYHALAMAHFRAGNIRILVCTDAAGMVCQYT